jgi:hypothetical protein
MTTSEKCNEQTVGADPPLRPCREQGPQVLGATLTRCGEHSRIVCAIPKHGHFPPTLREKT